MVITPMSKRLWVSENPGAVAVEGAFGSSWQLDKAEVAANLALLPTLEGPLLLLVSRVMDPQFLVPEVPDNFISQAIRLSPRFSLPFQAIYTYFHEDSWDKFAGTNLLERQRIAVMSQIYVRSSNSFLDSYRSNTLLTSFSLYRLLR